MVSTPDGTREGTTEASVLGSTVVPSRVYKINLRIPGALVPAYGCSLPEIPPTDGSSGLESPPESRVKIEEWGYGTRRDRNGASGRRYGRRRSRKGGVTEERNGDDSGESGLGDSRPTSPSQSSRMMFVGSWSRGPGGLQNPTPSRRSSPTDRT